MPVWKRPRLHGRNSSVPLTLAVPTAELRYFDGGRFVLDEFADAIAEAIIETFYR
jgi:hypothetical protein